MRLGSRSSLQASYDSAYGTSRLSYQRSAGEGVGSYSAGADVERSSAGTNFSGNFNYTSNRAEFAVSHLSSFGKQFGLPRDARTNIRVARSEEHTSELQSLMRISYAVFCLKKKNTTDNDT